MKQHHPNGSTSTHTSVAGALFITGTDTSVGKTYVAARLLDYCIRNRVNAGYQKWVSTGEEAKPADLLYCLDAAAIEPEADLLDLQVPYRFKRPASPHLAAEDEGKIIEPDTILTAFVALKKQHDLLIVEGVGGMLVPLRRDLLLADLVARLRLPTLVVARSGLGTLNHTLLTIEAIRARKIPLMGVVFSDATATEDPHLVADNMRTIAAMADVAVLGRIVRQPSLPDKDQVRRIFSPIGTAILAAMDRPT